jgi:hypothetical protein
MNAIVFNRLDSCGSKAFAPNDVAESDVSAWP